MNNYFYLRTGELINLAMYCERIRRKFWPEWFVDLEDFCYDSDNGTSSGTPTCTLDLGLFSRTDSLEESDLSLPSHSNTHSQDSDHSARSLSDSDNEADGSDVEQQVKDKIK